MGRHPSRVAAFINKNLVEIASTVDDANDLGNIPRADAVENNIRIRADRSQVRANLGARPAAVRLVLKQTGGIANFADDAVSVRGPATCA